MKVKLHRALKHTFLLLTSYLLLFTFAFPQGAAPGGPGADAHWATAAKQAVGTSATSDSKIWFTLANGVLTEVYYPNLETPNVHFLQFVVVDPETKKVETEFDDAIHELKVLRPDSLSFQQINTAKSGKWKITKTYATDPNAETLWIKINFEPEDPGLKLFVYYDPSLSNSGMGDSGTGHYLGLVGRVFDSDSLGSSKAKVTAVEASLAGLISWDEEIASLLQSSVRLGEFTNEYLGVDQLSRYGEIRELFAKAADGNVVQMARILEPGEFTLTLAFGESVEDVIATSIETTSNVLKSSAESQLEPFETVQAAYDKGWADYVATLPEVDPDHQAQFNMAAMVLKAHEDKTFRGANVASMSIPWGGGENANENDIGGYHLVWPRDLYHVFTAYLALGDREAAERALDYLLKYQQKPDGSFHQNTWLDGRPHFKSLQMDEVAYPLIMAWQLGKTDKATYENHLKKAADFIVKNGPSTPQERWEEESGYSPSTIAAEIAGLICAADIARWNKDEASALIYEAAADDWARKVEMWTATTTGKHGDGNYYLRITQNGDPNAGEKIELNNGGGIHDERDIVDAGFLELVRLGIKPPDDPLIAKSLKVIDDLIKVETPNGPAFYRYNNDGYGEMDDGRRWNWDGKYTGKGRLWTLLSGERGQYELALAQGDRRQETEDRKSVPGAVATGKTEVRSQKSEVSRKSEVSEESGGSNKTSREENYTGHPVYGRMPINPRPVLELLNLRSIVAHRSASSRLDHMADFANEGLMIPEQVWDKKETPKNIDRQFVPELTFGEGTGSATPLAWSMAQFVRLAVNLKAGKNLDTPSIVYKRYVEGGIPPNATDFGGMDEVAPLPVGPGEKFSYSREAPKGTRIGFRFNDETSLLEVGEDGKFTISIVAPEKEEIALLGYTMPSGATAFERVKIRPAGVVKPEPLSAETIAKIRAADSGPIIEASRAVIFYKGEAGLVMVAGDNTNWSPGRIFMQKISDGLHAVSLELQIDARLEYKLIVDGKWIVDPANPKRINNGVGNQNSIIEMPEYRPTEWAENKDRGLPSESVAEMEVESAKFGKRIVKVYLPSEYFRRGIAPKLPVVYFLDGSNYISHGAAINIAENLIAARKVEPFMMVFTDPVDRMKEYWASDDFAEYIAKEVVPAVENKYFSTIAPGRENRAIIGASLGGITSIWTALRHPEVFRNVGAQSASFWVDDERVIETLKRIDPDKGDDFNFFLDDGTLEGSEDSRRVNVMLRAKGYQFRYAEGPTGHNFTAWRDRLGEALIVLLN
ncbi:MAG: hypothetical protein DWQ47_05630 [Acidobacteria bacterium]|nr:MAG: hypothetical protein DWQ32_09180 [Acidobacteriota bacterium]REK01860.1 MAG: hypothetical protein DWQ38_05615 [Acidobacteriota bacterium]REK14816.1 MAG: hypothetical protein DWQ43_14870 [Acidobacteriota bacterium]REK45531.1 MAG: hypothetical protein DWQ47_05630 [Acidobacteriota bacterium]